MRGADDEVASDGATATSANPDGKMGRGSPLRPSSAPPPPHHLAPSTRLLSYVPRPNTCHALSHRHQPLIVAAQAFVRACSLKSRAQQRYESPPPLFRR
jgi:hypothetical protein